MKVYKMALAVLMLTLVSIGAVAQVKVVFGEKGEEKFPGTGGTITVSQDTKGDEVTVTLTVTPDKGYTITKGDIKVYATYPPSGTRTPEIADDLTLYFNGSEKEDVKDPSEKRYYTFTIGSNFGAWVKEANFQPKKRDGAKGTDYSGVYYIANDNTSSGHPGKVYSSASDTEKYYLVPAANPQQTNAIDAYYSPDHRTTNGDPEKPFLATALTNKDLNSIWIVTESGESGYYYIIHALTGKYVIYEVPLPNDPNTNTDGNETKNGKRKTMHLQTIDNGSYNPSTNDNFKFAITTSGSGYNICPKKRTGWYWNPAGQNNDVYYGQSSGENLNLYRNGLVGVYNNVGTNSIWHFEGALSIDAPTITNNFDGKITIEAASGATIYYTTNGDTPTTTSSVYSTPITLTGDITVIKAIAKAESDPLPTLVTTYTLPVCEKPVITQSGNMITITCTTEDAEIHYTTNGDHPTSNSTKYTRPFDKGNAKEIRAIATKKGYANSSEAAILPPTEVSSSDEMTDMSGNYILASNFTSASSIGTSGAPFKGTIDGNMATISGLNHPLVAYANGATIKNVILDNVTIGENAEGNAGAICCEALGDTRIYNCGVKSGTISGTNAGSIVGKLDGNSRVVNCYSFATVSGGTWGAGIVGYNSFSSTRSDLRTMVMNCMFYGEISSGTNISPIYGGNKITNVSNLNGYNYYRFDANYSRNNNITAYNCALAAEEKYLTRFEFFRNILNSNRELAAWYATGDPSEGKGIGNACKMAKWVLDPADKPYPILKTQGYYPSVINYEDAPNLGTIDLTIKESNTTSGGQTKPTGASINSNYPTTLTVYDKDLDHKHFNYRTVRLPYYNEVGTGNCTKNKVVTGWKITGFSGGTQGHFVNNTLDYSGTTHGEGVYPPYNFADRYCTDKDKFSVSGRIFSQGAYYDVPEGVTGITIEPYWGTAVYLSDPTYDVAYPKGYGNKNANAVFVSNMGSRYVGGNTASINDDNQTVYTDYDSAFGQIASSGTVYDNAIVLVGNYHHYWGPNSPSTTKAFTIMSADLNNDCEPDYGFIVQHGTNRQDISAIRFDFINSPGLGMIQKVETDKAIPKHGIWCPKGWFEVTNTTLIQFTQFEYDKGGKSTGSPLILLGGIYDQFITARQQVANSTEYIHMGSNIWMKEFCNGVHTNAQNTHTTRHIPISVTGGEFESFYLTGTFRPSVNSITDNAECYINGGKFGDMAGAGQEQLKGDVTWLIDHADITNFYGGGINGQKPITGNIYVEINNSNVELYCGGPKFGNMSSDKKVTTKAKGSTFGNFYGAGYGGTSYFRDMTRDVTGGSDWDTYVGDYTRKFVSGKGISTEYEYEFIPYSGGQSGQADYVGRFYVLYASLSLAETKDVKSTLEDCHITGSFYGGGKLGRVDGDIISTLNNCIVGENVFGAGFSASVEKVNVVPKGAKMKTNPAYNESVGVFTDGVYPDGVPYTWTQAASVSEGNEFDDTDHLIYTTVDLTGLGTVTGSVTLTIDGNTTLTDGKVMTVGESVYGGGEESGVNGNTTVNVTGGTIGVQGQGGATWGNVYGGGKGKEGEVTAGLVKGNTNVNIIGSPQIWHNVYGGGAYGSVGTFKYDATSGMPTALKTANTGACTVTIKGGTIGSNGDENGMVFGSSRGDVATPEGTPAVDPNDRMAWVYSTQVNIGTENATTGPTIKGSVYGSGENGHTFQNTELNIYSGTIGIPTGSPITDNNGTPEDTSDDKTYSGASYPYRGNVYGGGCGTDKYDSDSDGIKDKYNPLAGIVKGTTTVNITGGQVVHNVYGAGAMGSVGGGAEATSGKTTINITGGRIGYDGDGNGHVFGAARGEYGVSTAASGLANVRETAVNINYATTPAADNADKNVLLIAGSVFGGGEAGTVKESVAVNMTGGLVLKDVYGGGALADTQTSNWDATANENAGGWADADKKSALHTTTVRLTGGRVGEEVFGGGLGEAGKPAYIWGDVLVDLNGTTLIDGTTHKPSTTGTVTTNVSGCAVGQIFGCNNVNGTPKGDVMVHVYATQNKLTTTIAQKFIREKDCDTEKGEEETDEAYVTRLKGILTGKITFAEALDITVSQGNKDLATSETATAAALKKAITGITTSIDAKTTAEINAARYDMVAVYGGGNMAAYVPVDPNTAEASTASNPTEPNGSRTQVIIEGCEETSIETVYGGGNAAAVPETNVEIREAYEIQAVFGGGNGKDNLPNGDPNPGADIGTLDHGSSIYGTGNANSALKGGYIHEAYGGSNTKGIVKGNLNQTTNPEGSCELIMDKIVGAGKYADIDGDVNMTLTCQPSTKVPELFAGADEANVNGNITLNITNGHFGKVFGGNNLGGAVKGKITVNVKETGCQPIRIDELYLGGNEAAYSVFGYYESEKTHPVTGKKILKPRESATDTHLPVQYDGTSYASISDFTNYAQPELNIISCTYIGKVFGGGLGEPAIMYANPTVNINMIPGTATGSLSGIGTIGDVYGGGNAAKIVGNTTVNIGTDETVLGANITGNVYGGGNLADVAGDTYVNICAKYDNVTDKFVAVAEGTSGVTIGGNVFGGGKGSADTYECEAAMVGEVDKDYGSTHVVIGNGTVGTVENGKLKEKTGNVYGGGEIGRVEKNTSVTIGLSSEGVSITSAPVIEGKVFGAGCGLRTHGYSALVRGDATVTIQANAQVKGNVYGGGEMSTVGKYWVKGVQYPASLNPPPAPDWVYDWMPYQWRSGGTCTVSILDHAVIGPDNNMKMDTDNGPDDAGHVFGACQGVLPYQGFTDTEKPWRMQQGNIEDYFYINNKFSEDEYFRFIETLALATKTEVTIGDNAFVMGSVYGGSENGRVQEDTHVTIQDNCQIGCGDGITTPYTAAQWESENPADFKECASWTFEPPYAPYDMYKLDANGKPIKATDGHTFYGNVFGGGSGYYPYKQDPDYEVRKQELGGKSKKELGYADGLWFENAGAVYGNTQVDITGGHILTSVYGGNEMTNVGTYKNDRDYVEKGHCVINMSGGTVGVPRSSDDAKHHPVTCYVFGAGKGDPRINFNRWTNVASTEVNITGNARIFGSTFGGGEDGHVIGDAVTTVNGDDVIIGSTGTSGVDGNIFGGGRGFSEDALTAGVVGGNVTVNFKNGKILGTLYGGGRLASVGTNFANVEDTQHYGKMQADTETQTHGHITVNIEGGTIGATDDAGNLMASDSSIGDVFGGCKGSSSETPNMDYGLSKYTQINMTGGKVNGSVYGGGEVAMVEANTTIQISGAEKVDNVYGGGKGLIDHAEAGMIQGDTHVTISEAQGKTTTISHNVYGGGEAGVVNGNVAVDIMGGHVMQDVYGGGALANTNTGNWGPNNTWAEGKYSNLATFYKTNVTLKGGTIDGNVYGGGLGRQEKDEVQAVEGSGTYGQPDYVEPVPYQPAVSPIEALVYGDVLVKLNENTEIDKCVVKGSVFGCNNLNGSPQSAVTVHVYKTWGDAMTAQADLDDPDDSKHHYHLAAVYGGGNQSAFYPQFKDTRDSVQTRVIIDGCDLSSIRQVYGGGNAASSPATSVTINSAYEIEEVFGGGNGYGTMPDGSVNPGANVGYTHYPVEFDPPASTVEYRTNNYGYGSGVASVNIFNGRIHRVFGGSNTKGNVRKSAVTILEKMSEDCAFVIDEVYGGGKSAPMDAEAKLLMSCIPGLKEVYGGAQNADINNNVVLNITNGEYDRVFGGNNKSGSITGAITVNIEETGCKPVIIGQVYGGGNLAAYNGPWVDENDHSKGRQGPTVNVKAFTSIGEVYGGGYGASAKVTGDTYVNVNEVILSKDETGQSEDYSIKDFKQDVIDEDHPEQEYKTMDLGNDNKIKLWYRPVKKDSNNVPIPAMGVIGNVFGGGNAAPVEGSTHVNIGNKATETIVTLNDLQKEVKGVDIRGNVYGGGNKAEVTGNTNVVVGKSSE